MRRLPRRAAAVILTVVVAITAAVVIRAGAGANLCPKAQQHPAGDRASAAFASSVPLGAAVRWDRVADSPGYAAFYLAHYSWMTPENELKMNALEPEPGNFSFGTADSLVDWARGHGKQVHGHVLIWGNDLPTWAGQLREGRPSRAGGGRTGGALGAYIVTVLRHFAGRVHEWDVVNEAFTPKGAYQDNVWYHELGPAYIVDAFRTARASDPSLRLCYNDLGTELPGPHERAVLALVRQLRALNLLDCVGFELHTDVPGPDRRAFEGVLRSFAATGADLLVSELDVVPTPGARISSADFRSRQATVYGNVARACRAVARCRRLTTWGFTDASSWLGATAQPLPFDTACEAKPAWKALRTALTAR